MPDSSYQKKQIAHVASSIENTEFQLMRRGFIFIAILTLLLIGASCATTRRAKVNSQRRGLLMLEGEHVYKNKGFYKEKKSSRRHKKNLKKFKSKRRR